jgi:hypothetical protein
MNPIRRTGISSLAAWLAFTGAGIISAPAADEPQQSALIPCLACTGDFQPIAPNVAAPAAGKELLVVFHLSPDEHFRKLVSRWVVDDVGPAAPPGHTIGQGELAVKDSTSGKFRYYQPKPLPVGRYHVDVLADGKPWKTAALTVVAAPVLAVSAPAGLLPLTEGRTWTYDFVQEAGPGAKLSESEMKPDADGKLRATVVMTVGKPEANGTHVLFARNGKTVSEEWWRLEAKGLAASRRTVDGELLVLNPPQVLLAMPTAGFMDWSYRAADGTFTQHYREWCLNVNGPPGVPSGLLVVTEQDLNPGLKVVAERHWVPGRGLVREVITTSLAAHLLSRQTMLLR